MYVPGRRTVYMAIHEQQKATLPSGPKHFPFVGNILAFRRDQLGFLRS